MSALNSRSPLTSASFESDLERLFTEARQILKAAEKAWPAPLGGFRNDFEERIRLEVIDHAVGSLLQDWKSRSENARRNPPESAI